jgi:hypothetical protein
MTKPQQNAEFRGLTIFEILVIAAVMLGSLFWAYSFRGSLVNKNYDTERKARVSTFKEHLRSYALENGSFPADEQFQTEETRNSLFASYLVDQGQDALNDPKDTDKLMSYSAEPEGCQPFTESPCTKVSVGFKLSTGELFIKFAVKPGSEEQYLNQTDQITGE